MTTEDRRRDTGDHGTRIALLEQSTAAIQKQLEGINVNINKLVWLVLAALVMAAMKFFLMGGLSA